MSTYVTTFRSGNTGAPTLSGTTGDLINVLSHCLIIGKVFSTANDTSFSDNTNNARLSDASGFLMFPTPATADRTYFGMSVTFANLSFSFITAGSSATYVWEYWNGTTWSTLTVIDGTSSFSVAGNVTWTTPGNWATTTVNASTMYWVRVRFTGTAPTTNPSVNTVSYLGWVEVQTGTNQRDYKQGSGSNGFIVSVNDNGPGVGLGKEARIKGFETSTGLGTGTNQFPTTAQGTAGTGGAYVIRKSASLDTAPRVWIIVADQRTWYLMVLTTDVATVYSGSAFGEFYSLIPNDPGRCLITGRFTENVATMTNAVEALSGIGTTNASLFGALARDAQGRQSPTVFTKMGDFYFKTAANGATNLGNFGDIAFPNPSDNKIYMAIQWVSQTAGGTMLRGRMRGMYQWGHPVTAASDGDIITGAGDLAGKTFLIIKSGPISDLYVIEISDTWESN